MYKFDSNTEGNFWLWVDGSLNEKIDFPYSYADGEIRIDFPEDCYYHFKYVKGKLDGKKLKLTDYSKENNEKWGTNTYKRSKK